MNISERLELRLSGSGGQGLITAGIILAQSAVFDGKSAVQTQSYGPEARGGASKAEVIISKSEIDFPKVVLPNMSLILTQVAADKYSRQITPDGVIIIDESIQLPEDIYCQKIIKAPILSTARNDLGREIVANVISLGIIAGIINTVTRDSIEKVLLARIPAGTEKLNLKALEAGYQIAKKIKN